jgi:hypothetical protein
MNKGNFLVQYSEITFKELLVMKRQETEGSEECTEHDVLNKRSFDVYIFRLSGKIVLHFFLKPKIKNVI